MASELASSGIGATALLRSPAALEHAGVSPCELLTKPELLQHLVFIISSATVVPSKPPDYSEGNNDGDDDGEPPTP